VIATDFYLSPTATWDLTGSYYSTNGTAYTHRETTATFVNWERVSFIAPLPRITSRANWRWFHSFYDHAAPILRPLSVFAVEVLRRAQERYPLAQRARQKRRAFLHSLRFA
jgi:hypothetical protein